MERNVSRRDFVKTVAGAGAAVALASQGGRLFAGQTPAVQSAKTAPVKTITMVTLPYAQDALAPFISARTVDLHYNKHHMSYYNQLKGWIGAHPEFQNQTLEELIAANQGGIRFAEAVFQFSILLYNHNCYWMSLKPKAGGQPKGKIGSMIDGSFGSYQAFRKQFVDEALHLGVGWVWVVLDGKAIKAYWCEYHDSPLLKGYVPLLTVDVWEHAYYMDYQFERQKYVEAVLDNLLNWEYAETKLAAAEK
jgi:superoxide dismutase, Fe-Mn family